MTYVTVGHDDAVFVQRALHYRQFVIINVMPLSKPVFERSVAGNEFAGNQLISGAL